MDADDEIACPVCHKEFTTKYSKYRHVKTVHSVKADKMDDVDENYSSDNSEETDFDEGEEGDISEKSTEEEDEDELCTEAWRYMLEKAFEDMNKQPETLDDLSKEPYLSEFIENLQKNVEFYDNIMHNLKSSYEYQQLQITKNRMKKLGCSSQEAEKSAWQIRKFIIKKLLEDNMDVLEDESDSDADAVNIEN